MTESERLFAAIKNISPGDVYVTSFADKTELDRELRSKAGKIELVESSTDYQKILDVLNNDETPSLLERIVERSTNKDGQLNPNSMLWFLRKTK